MKKFIRKVCVFLLILLLIAFSFSITKDIIIKTALQTFVRLSTELRLDIGKLTIDTVKTTIRIKDISLLNPSHFTDTKMLEIPDVYIDYDLPAILRGEIHLNDVSINLKQFTIVKNKDGRTNLSYIKNRGKKKSAKQKKKSTRPKFQIDNLALKIGKVIHKDYSAGEEVKISEYNVNIDSNYKNLKNAHEIIRIITAKALINTAVGKLSDIGNIKDIASGAVSDTTSVLSGTVEEGKNIIKNTLGEVKNLIKLPFKSGDQ